MNIRNMRTRMGTRGIILYPVGHLPLLSPEYKYESCEVSEHQNRASINAFSLCLLTHPAYNRHILGVDSHRKNKSYQSKKQDIFLKMYEIPRWVYETPPTLYEILQTLL